MVRGPVPKESSQVARRNNKGMERFLEVEPCPQPPLPAGTDPRAVEWWECWQNHPLSSSFTMLEWETLKLAVPFYVAGLDGDSRAAETFMKLTAKFGLTTEDRLRLRITTSVAKPSPAGGMVRKTLSAGVNV